jgi:two-component system, LytTR family, sensor kinase
MSKRLYLFLGSFVAFYYLVRVAYDMPNLVHGDPQFILLPHNIATWSARVRDILFYFLFALIPYLSFYRWYPQRKFYYALILVATFLPALFLLRYWAEQHGAFRNLRLRTYFVNTLFYTLIFAIYGTVFYFVRYSYNRDLRQKDLELQSRQSELSFLRSQINPHFLFNSLNNIYALVYQGSGQALTAIAGLSDLLRYMLYDTTEKVPLVKELDYIRKYIELQKLRFDHAIRADVIVEGNASEVNIAPLLFIPFVENAFKHGDFSGTVDGLAITVHCSGDKTCFYSANRISRQQKDGGGGIGLDNVKRRLNLLYPGKHKLSILDEGGSFVVNLELMNI